MDWSGLAPLVAAIASRVASQLHGASVRGARYTGDLKYEVTATVNDRDERWEIPVSWVEDFIEEGVRGPIGRYLDRQFTQAGARRSESSFLKTSTQRATG